MRAFFPALALLALPGPASAADSCKRLDWPAGPVALLTCHSSATESYLAIEVRGQMTKLRDARFANLGWTGAARLGDTLLGIADSDIESPGWELTLVVSRDEGRSWRFLRTVRKPYYLATMSAVRATSATSVCVELELDDDYGSGVRAGRYQACSQDAGAKWDAWRRVGDAKAAKKE
jgi:hypothetical protein